MNNLVKGSACQTTPWNQEELGGVDSGRSAAPTRFSLAQSNLRIAAPFDSAVRTYCPPMVRRNRVRPDGIQHAHDAEDEANTHLPAHKNVRAVQLLLGHTRLESAVRYPGIEVDDALEMAEQMDA